MAPFNGNNVKDTLAEKVKAVQNGERLIENIGKAQEYLGRELANAKAKIGVIALEVEQGTKTPKDFDAAKAEIEHVARELELKASASDEAARQLSIARQELNKAGAANRRKDAEKLAGQRSKTIEKIVRGYELVNEGLKETVEINDKLVVWGGIALQTNHGGTLLSRGELLNAISTEIGRICKPSPLANTVTIPGSKNYILGGNPADEVPLLDLLKQADAKMIELIANGPEPQPMPAAPGFDHPTPALPQTARADQIPIPRKKLA